MRLIGVVDVFEAAPSAASLIEGLRDFGYTMETALADIVDNSISAEAKNIRVFVNTDGSDPKIAVLDDGRGMSESELRRAMRPGSQNPLDARSGSDLGRFGLGMKTASFSQCRRVTVVTGKDGVFSSAAWDLDRVAKTDSWLVQVPSVDSVPWINELKPKGTLVVWENLDRVVGDMKPEAATRHLNQRVGDVEQHLGLVFHRFLVPEKGNTRIRMSINGRAIEPIDPFHSKHPATVIGPEETFTSNDGDLTFQSFTLPHHKKVSSAEWQLAGGPEGYVRNQGFYVYRSRRLIVRGTWFGLAKQSELTKLSRVRIDLPNSMDDSWKINVLKASAHPPPNVRQRLKTLIEVLGAASKRVYGTRGVRQASATPLPVWRREVTGEGIGYTVDGEHPAVVQFAASLDDDQKSQFQGLLSLIKAGLPMDALLNDLGDSPEKLQPEKVEDLELFELVRQSVANLKGRDVKWERIEEMMAGSPPFDSQWEQTKGLIRQLRDKNDDK